MTSEVKKILLVEDDKFLRELYVEVLRDEGFKVTEATDGKEALGQMEKGGYDLVILDIMLPKIDGLDILKKLNAEGKLEKNKVLFVLTNLSPEVLTKKMERIEVDEYLIKSDLTPDQLVAKVKQYLD